MSLFLRLLAVVSTTVLLRDSIAGVVITAPSTVIEENAGLETRKQGPTAWICSALDVTRSWTAYANIRSYLEGGNAEGKDYTNMVLYPVMELFHDSESRLCVYLPSIDHCFPPAPSNNQVKTVKQLYSKNYYDIRFWGQARDSRVQYYKQKLMAALNVQSKVTSFNIFFVSYFSDHVREVRYDPARMSRNGSPAVPSDGESLTCVASPDTRIRGTTEEMSGQEYLLTSLVESRLSLTDVQTQITTGGRSATLPLCGSEASQVGINAFSFKNGICKLYKLEENFCSCAEGNFEIYINKNRWGETNELTRETTLLEGLKRVVIYAEIPLVTGHIRGSLDKFEIETDTRACERYIKIDPVFLGAIIVDNKCYVTAYHDLHRCNQTCRGQPVDAIIRNVSPSPSQPFLSLCGQKVYVPKIFEDGRTVSMYHPSHAGYGCYPYQDARTPEEGDCVVDFEVETENPSVYVGPIILNMYNDSVCEDLVSVNSPNNEYFSSCRGDYQKTLTGKFFQIRFYRNVRERDSGTKDGFTVSIVPN